MRHSDFNQVFHKNSKRGGGVCVGCGRVLTHGMRTYSANHNHFHFTPAIDKYNVSPGPMWTPATNNLGKQTIATCCWIVALSEVCSANLQQRLSISGRSWACIVYLGLEAELAKKVCKWVGPGRLESINFD